MNSPSQLAVIGGGPAGLRAAEVAATAGVQVTLYDAKPSVGRKFLVAGKGGLNLTHGNPSTGSPIATRGRISPRLSGPDCSPALIRLRCANGRRVSASKRSRPPAAASIRPR